MWTCYTAKPNGTQQKAHRINKGSHTHTQSHIVFLNTKESSLRDRVTSKSNPLFAKAFSLCLGLHSKNQHNAAASKPQQNFPVQKRFTTGNCIPHKKHPDGSSCSSPASELGVKRDKTDATTSLNNPSALFICKLHLYSGSKVNY